MKEILEILKRVDSLSAHEKAVLATVVDLKGSGYRLPGARMLIEQNGDAIGTVSGGCLEADVMERAKRVIASGTAEVFTYDTMADENSVFSLNMGCRGVMRILLEPVSPDAEIIQRLNQVYESRRPVVSAVGISGEYLGNRIFLADGTFSDDQLLTKLPGLEDDLLTFAGSTSHFETIEYKNGVNLDEFAVETLLPPIRLIILGAGADAVPLARTAHEIGWQVAVYDHRPAYLTAARFENVELVLVERSQTPALAADDRTAIVVMNHNYDRDKVLLPAALDTDAFYVGALGPRDRTRQILNELESGGQPPSTRGRSILRSPAGLDIGGDSPESIAVSIIAEIQSVLKHRPGGALQDRNAPIYDH